MGRYLPQFHPAATSRLPKQTMPERNPTPPNSCITLQASDGRSFPISHALASEFDTVTNYIEDADFSTDVIIPLPNVSSVPLLKIVNLCTNWIQFRDRKSHPPLPSSSDAVVLDIDAFIQEFLKGESNEDLVELLMAANYLSAKDLLSSLNQAMADRIQNKSVEYVRKLFGIESDYTPEEEAELRLEYAWAFEGVDED